MRNVIFGAIAAISFVGVAHAGTIYDIAGVQGQAYACTITKDVKVSCSKLEGNKLIVDELQKVAVNCQKKTVKFPGYDLYDLAPYEKAWDNPRYMRDAMAVYLHVCKGETLAFNKTGEGISGPNQEAYLGKWYMMNEGTTKVPRHCSLKRDDPILEIKKSGMEAWEMSCNIKKWRKVGDGYEVTSACTSEGDDYQTKQFMTMKDDTLVIAGDGDVNFYRKCK